MPTHHARRQAQPIISTPRPSWGEAPVVTSSAQAYVTAMWPIDRPRDWVGRGAELAILRARIEALGRGERAVVWVEGKPGIGKPSLIAEALVARSEPG